MLLHHRYDNHGVDPLSYEEDQRIGETVMERTGGYPQVYHALYTWPVVTEEDYWFLRWPILNALRKKMIRDQLS
jgi:hypothetical protein